MSVSLVCLSLWYRTGANNLYHRQIYAKIVRIKLRFAVVEDGKVCDGQYKT